MALIVIYTLWAGLPDQTMTAVEDYDDLSGECLTDAHEALRSGLAVMIKPSMTTAEDYAEGERSPNTPFLHRYAAAVLADNYMSPDDRAWLLKRKLIREEPRSTGNVSDTGASQT